MNNWIGISIFIPMVVIGYIGAHLYIYFRFTRAFGLNKNVRMAIKIAIFSLALLSVIGRILYHLSDTTITQICMLPGTIWMGILALGVVILLCYDLLFSLPLLIMNKIKIVPKIDFHKFGLLVVIGLTVISTTYSIFKAVSTPSLQDIEINIPDLPATLDGVKIVHVTDIHYGGFMTKEKVESILDVMRADEPDIVVYTGDFSDHKDGGEGDNNIFPLLGSIKTRYGVFAVLGNHEKYMGGDKVAQKIEKAGIQILRQSHVVIGDGLVLAGIDDPTFLNGKRKVGNAMDQALEGVKPSEPIILLSHQPIRPEYAERKGVDLMLCGHTHGGQIPPFHLITGFSYNWWLAGEYWVGNMLLYVNPGAGFWGPPMRLFADPVVARIVLRSYKR